MDTDRKTRQRARARVLASARQAKLLPSGQYVRTWWGDDDPPPPGTTTAGGTGGGEGEQVSEIFGTVPNTAPGAYIREFT